LRIQTKSKINVTLNTAYPKTFTGYRPYVEVVRCYRNVKDFYYKIRLYKWQVIVTRNPGEVL